jgi:site-specific recombinase XerD
VRAWEAENTIDQGTDSGPVTIKEASESFLADAEARGLRDGTVRKYRLLFRHLQGFADAQGFRYLKELDTASLRKFRASWHDRNLSALKKLERLRSFFRFACENGWATANPAKKLQRPEVSQRPTMPFSQTDMVAILAACNEWGKNYQGATRARENSWRIRALVLLLRYSGLRIQDAVTLGRDRITGGKLFLYTAKTGTPVYLPLPGFVVEALDRAPTCKAYFFWTGDSKAESATKNWQSSLRELFGIAGVVKGHAHRFRDTLAVDMLMAGVPMERVSVVLGHSSVRVTEKYYAPWIRARQAQLEDDVKRSWQSDPLWLAETKGTPGVHGKREFVN